MARLFISCNHQDFELGKRLERALIGRGHVMTLRIDARPENGERVATSRISCPPSIASG